MAANDKYGFTKVALSGASGFVGRALCRRLLDEGAEVVAACRKLSAPPLFSEHLFSQIQVGDIGASTDWSAALDGVGTIFHLAAHVHVIPDAVAASSEEFFRVNTEGTEHLARSAAASGAKRLVYVSSIKVNGKATHGDKKFTAADTPAPQDPYAVSKWKAEQALHRVARETGLEVVIVRPPLVYGPGVRGNFAQMLDIVAQRIPLPFASVHNLRDLVYVENLVDALVTCAAHPAAAGQTYLVCDGESVSTPDLLRRLAAEMQIRSSLFLFPPALLRLVAKVGGKSQQMERLLGSLQVDGDKMRTDLNWVPPYSLRQGLHATAKWHQTNGHGELP